MDKRTRSQRWADNATEFSGSWSFIGLFTIICMLWITYNIIVQKDSRFDPYPFLFLNWILTIISTFQNPLILLSQNRQNETDRERVSEVLNRLTKLQETVDALSKKKPTFPTESELNSLCRCGCQLRTHAFMLPNGQQNCETNSGGCGNCKSFN